MNADTTAVLRRQVGDLHYPKRGQPVATSVRQACRLRDRSGTDGVGSASDQSRPLQEGEALPVDDQQNQGKSMSIMHA